MEYLTGDHRALAESQLGLIRAQFDLLNEAAQVQVKDLTFSGHSWSYGKLLYTKPDTIVTSNY